MPYSPERVRSLLQTAPVYNAMPGGEFIRDIAEQLQGAEKVVDEMRQDLRAANQGATITKSQLKLEEERHDQTRRQMEKYLECIQAVANGAKDARALALTALGVPDEKPKRKKKVEATSAAAAATTAGV